MTPQPIRVLIVDDSSYMRFVLGKVLGDDPGIEVVAAARDGLDALRLLDELQPDVITLDIEMPRMNGYETLVQIMGRRPTPVIMVSSYAESGDNATIRALELGAVDFVRKPDRRESLTMDAVRDELIAKIKMAASVHPEAETPAPAAFVKKAPQTPQDMKKLVVIASSTGGPKALAKVLPAIPSDLPVGIIVVQHMPVGFTASLAARLDQLCPFQVAEAREDDVLRAGRVLVAPGGFHLRIRPQGRVRLSASATVNNVRPAADVTMEDAAAVYGDKVIAVVLTGMGADGTRGCAAIRAKGGATIAQNAATCVVDGMPASLIKAGHADYIVPLSRIAREIQELV